MITCEIDLQSLDTCEKIHDFFEDALDLPEYYGRNFDALYDMLTSITEAILFICMMGESRSVCANQMLLVLEDAAAENSNIKIELT